MEEEEEMERNISEDEEKAKTSSRVIIDLESNNEEEEEEALSHLDTSEAKRQVWLLKCPKMVDRVFKSSSSSSSSSPFIAKLVVSIDPQHPKQDTSASLFNMELAGEEIGNIPRKYNMNLLPMDYPTSVFSVSSRGKASVEGEILRKFDITPDIESIDSYGKIVRERTRKSMVKTRQTIQLIGKQPPPATVPLPGTCPKNVIGKETKQERRVRTRSRNQMEEMLFKLFESKPSWSFAELIQQTDQPRGYLKEVLNEICDRFTRVGYYTTYSLKPEYRTDRGETE